MKISIEEALRRLEASPEAAAAFDRAARRERPHCKNRREAVEAVLAAINALEGEVAATRAKVAASKQKLAALEAAKLKNDQLKRSLAMAKARISAAAQTAPASLTAAELLGLSDVQAAALLDKAAFASSGRAVRRQIKRALMAASPLEKGRLFARYESAITSFPNESIS